MKGIGALPLTVENFRDYGSLLHLVDEEPMNDNEEFQYWGKISSLEMGPTVSTGMVYAHRREPVVRVMERHLDTPEVMVALEGDFIICVGQASDKNENIEGVKAFYVKQGEAFALGKRVWHWAPYPVDSEGCKILIAFASGTEDNDLELKDLEEPMKVVG
jgi:ureidoglycolate hydrolase